ncbi:5-formyltetrahydrofolate cyclo-ligase [Halobacillus sp. A5]|uniref:5-formyltetrahydrofolate cyclo-ligase n=1 Tax=Halobacillus sp. A5 TaxID=2880263 RepID=UPI0020A6A6D7|nr:5-formyltetrahydrofolate cyclo-ligase [Halobacillus sp. A5]MCP3025680.1 5-formyltetrahydrofolate cyclo-ligase [Halobacillus sp. A5]
MKKQLLREQGKLILKSFTKAEKTSVEERLYQQLFQSNLFKHSETVALTVSLADEWNTYPIIEQAWKEHKQVLVPKCDRNTKAMTFYQLENLDQLETVYYGLKEPSPEISKLVKKSYIQLIVVPGLLFDHKGFRIGYGGGFYDRYLKDYQGTTASLLSRKQLIEKVPSEPFDQPVQQLFTEDGIIKTTGYRNNQH